MVGERGLKPPRIATLDPEAPCITGPHEQP